MAQDDCAGSGVAPRCKDDRILVPDTVTRRVHRPLEGKNEDAHDHRQHDGDSDKKDGANDVRDGLAVPRKAPAHGWEILAHGALHREKNRLRAFEAFQGKPPAVGVVAWLCRV